MKKDTNLFTILTQILVVILPFYVFLSIFLAKILSFPIMGFFLKEWILVLIFFALVYEFFKAKKFPKLDIIDFLVIFFIVYWVWITLLNWLWLKSVIYGWRYDFMFLIVLLIYKHWAEFLKVKPKKLMKLFLYSWAWALLFGFCLKFRFKEEFLVEFWYVDYISSRVYSGWVPVYHWLENSWIRRFQWIFDWPNAMAFFLILFSWIFLYLQKKKNEFYVYCVILFMFWLLLLTYSRSALLWVFMAFWMVILLNLKYLYKHYKKTLLWICVFWLVFLSIFGLIFQDKIINIVLRPSSTTGHFDRMWIGIDRFLEKPLGAGLAESWPGYRYIYPEKQTKEDEIKYIPESWFIQVLVEWWILYFLAFVSILFIILVRLLKSSIVIFWVFFAVLVMNIFLHSFEATYLSTLLFLFAWLFVKNKYNLE
jgi:hypothetical protein